MKIKTEILKSIYILTCEGPSLTPSVIEVFLGAMKVLIQKNQMDIHKAALQRLHSLQYEPAALYVYLPELLISVFYPDVS